ncbi:MAG: alpha/beta hydrolase [Pseudomonadota bacterium]|nr:alpha/beta hydrolase [Pseudomonadota bacterium]
MLQTLILLALVIGTAAVLRVVQLDRETTRPYARSFDGEVYRVGAAYLAVRRARQRPRCSVIAVPGFLEEIWYFAEQYDDPDIELILYNNADYHLPIESPAIQEPAWGSMGDQPVGTIEYDAEIVNRALEHLVSSAQVRIHGHSRGGAVVLEAALQRPDLHRDGSRAMEYVLEAPVLPGGRIHYSLAAGTNSVGLWLMPALMPVMRRLPMALIGRVIFGPPRCRLAKLDFASRLWRNPRRARTVVTNVRNIVDWMKRTDARVYQSLSRGLIAVGHRDLILSRRHMIESATRAEPVLQVVQPDGCSHMVIQDRPDVVPPPYDHEA